MLINSDCLDAMVTLTQNSIDTIITDPPYGLTFMGKDWDKGVPGQAFWLEMLRVAKPGAMLLSFGGTRTYHRMTCAIEDAGWEIRDCMMWLYGSGFPKSHDISKGIDKAKGAEREVVGVDADFVRRNPTNVHAHEYAGGVLKDGIEGGKITAPASDLSRTWNGWGTALKPAWEPIIVAMKPLDGTFAHNAETYGVAGLNIDGARIQTVESLGRLNHKTSKYIDSANGSRESHDREIFVNNSDGKGRWPANLILDEACAELLDEQTGDLHSAGPKQISGDEINAKASMFGIGKATADQVRHGDSGGASRFFYCAKASKSERNTGLPEGQNVHPTVKPLKLMEYLCTLTKTPTGGIVLDPFMGSGTTGVACRNTGREFIGIEKEEAYFKIAQARIESAKAA